LAEAPSRTSKQIKQTALFAQRPEARADLFGNGKYLYDEVGTVGAVDEFRIKSDGSLTPIGSVPGLGASSLMGMRAAGWPPERVADQTPVPCEWVRELSGGGVERERATARLHETLLRVARAEAGRRGGRSRRS
jgi:hypothetical protein